MSHPSHQLSNASKRVTPPTSTLNNNVKRSKSGEYTTGEQQASSSAQVSSGANVHSMDPDQLSDALHSAGVNLKEEEHLLSKSLQQQLDHNFTRTSTVYNQQVRTLNQPYFLSQRNLSTVIRKIAAETGIKHINDKEGEIFSLISVSCEEWLSDILTSAITLSRHRTRSRNDVRSSISKALRNISIKDKETEDRRNAKRAALRLDDSGQSAGKDISEERLHRAANATALMMTSGRKYSWMTGTTGGSTSGTRQPGPSAARTDNSIRYREVREEPGITLRDLLAALEQRRVGVEKAIIKGYAKVKN